MVKFVVIVEAFERQVCSVLFSNTQISVLIYNDGSSLFNHLKRMISCVRRLLCPPCFDIRLYLSTSVILALHRLTPRPPIRHDTRPSVLNQILVLQVRTIIRRPALPDLRACCLNTNSQNRSRAQFSLGGRISTFRPPFGKQVVGDEFHCIQGFCFVRDQRSISIGNRRTVVARIVKGREGEDQAVEERCCNCYGQTSISGFFALLENAARDVAVDVQVLCCGLRVRGAVLKVARAAQHRQDYWERMFWVIEGHVQYRADVDECVDCCEVVCTFTVIRTYAIDLLWMTIPLFASRPSLLTAVLEYCDEAIVVVVFMISSLVLPCTQNTLPYNSSPESNLMMT